MHDKPIRDDRAQIYCRAETKEEVRALKWGSETFDDVLRRLANKYYPGVGHELEGADGGV